MPGTAQEKPKTWDESRQRRQLTLSASQISTAQLCVRKWWLERVRRLTVTEDPTKFIFGSVFHTCVERFLLADDTGRDPKTGKQVELFPEGWKQDINRYTGEVTGEVCEEDAGIIQALVTKGIESGVLAPYPDRRIESEFNFPLGKIESGVEGSKPVTVRIVGFIDCSSRNTVIDHKTTSNMRYALSPNKLAEDPQMLLYAKVLLEDLRGRGESPDQIVLRHNQFCKDANKMQVRATEASVTVRYIEQHWQTVTLPVIRQMVRFRDLAKTWADMPEPDTGYRACNKYGGCGYMNICGGRITESTMEKRMQLANSGLDSLQQAPYTDTKPVALTVSANSNPKESTMPTLKEKLDALKAKNNAAGAGTESAAVPDAKEEEVQAPVPPKQEAAAAAQAPEMPEMPEGMEAPPWANPKCTACLGLGFNTVGNPCRVCDIKADKEVQSKNFKITPEPDGSFIWVHKQDEEIVGISPGPSYGREEPLVSERTEEEAKDEVKPKPKPKAKPEPAAATAPAKASPVTPAEPPEDIDLTGTSASTGFHLFINCRPTKTGKGIPKTYDLHEILEDARNTLAKVSGVDSFYDLDPFKRKDRIAELAPQVAEQLGRGALIATGFGTGMSEGRALLDALKPLAKQVIVADAN